MREIACAMSEGARAVIWLVVADEDGENEDMVRMKKDALPLASGRMPLVDVGFLSLSVRSSQVSFKAKLQLIQGLWTIEDHQYVNRRWQVLDGEGSNPSRPITCGAIPSFFIVIFH
jgi:hypothetical protein